MRSPFRIVPGSVASVGSGVERRACFSLPFNSAMSSVRGSIARSLAVAGLSSSVALKVLVPMVSFIGLLFVSPRGLSRWTSEPATAARCWLVASQPVSPTSRPAARRAIRRELLMASLSIPSSLQVVSEERRQLIERDDVHAVVEVDVPRVRDDEQLFRLGGELVGVLAELDGMGLLARDEEQRAGRNRLDVVERIEVHELDVAGQGRMRGQLGRAAFGRELAARRAIEVVELPLDGVGACRKLVHGPARVLGLAARELDVTPGRGCGDGLLPLLGRHGFPEPMTIRGPHVVHADGRDGLQTRVNLGGTDNEAPAAANPDGPDAALVDERSRTQQVRGGTEALRVEVGRHDVARLALALAPEGQIK